MFCCRVCHGRSPCECFCRSDIFASSLAVVGGTQSNALLPLICYLAVLGHRVFASVCFATGHCSFGWMLCHLGFVLFADNHCVVISLFACLVHRFRVLRAVAPCIPLFSCSYKLYCRSFTNSLVVCNMSALWGFFCSCVVQFSSSFLMKTGYIFWSKDKVNTLFSLFHTLWCPCMSHGPDSSRRRHACGGDVHVS